MALLITMKQQQKAALAKAEQIVTAAEAANRNPSESETADMNAALAEVDALTPQIQAIEKLNTLKATTGGIVLPSNNAGANGESRPGALPKEYIADFAAYGKSRGLVAGSSLVAGADDFGGFKIPNMDRPSAISYEGNPASAGLMLPTLVSGDIIPLAPPILAAFDLVNVVPTVHDTKYPRQVSFAQAFAKAESGTTLNTFQGVDPTVDSFTLSANMMGIILDASWELLQDLPQWYQFLKSQQLLALAILREYAILQGQQGICGSLLAGATVGIAAVQPDTNGNVIPAGLLEDLVGGLPAAYTNDRTAFLMNRRTAVGLRKQQFNADRFNNFFVRQNGTEFLFDTPVRYSDAMPLATPGSTPVVVGDFSEGYIYGERGGNGVNVKILDQTKAAAGVLQVLSYQRVDGHVRVPAALQALTIHA